MKNILKILRVSILILSFSLIFSGCSQSSDPYSYEYYDSYDTYEDEVITSENWECTEDCSGHDAGYEWASENEITDPYDCDGNSNSFIEGCEAYANEYLMEREEYYNDEYEYMN